MDDITQELSFEGPRAAGRLAIPVGGQRLITTNVYEGTVIIATQTKIIDVPAGSQQTSLNIDMESPGTGSSGEFSTEGMVLIPAGEFSMGDQNAAGSNDERPVHDVYLDAYYIDVHEVTNAQFAAFLTQYGGNADPEGHELVDIDNKHCFLQKAGSVYEARPGYEDHPVQTVSWYGAAAYAQFYNKRLPTEAEWEKAARGGAVGKKFPWGDKITHADANYIGNHAPDEWEETAPVGSFPANGYGLYDMIGNVFEWCADQYDKNYYNESSYRNPKGPGDALTFQQNDFVMIPAKYRVRRGGSWRTPTSWSLRCAKRFFCNPKHEDVDQGFRCVQYAH